MSAEEERRKKYHYTYDYNSRVPTYIDVDDLTEEQVHRLIKSETFCILPWMHLHAFPDGRAYPCCMSDMHQPIGSLRENTMKEVWNSEDLKQMRQNMLNDKPCSQCTKCYEQEQNGFFSMRNAQNKDKGHYIDIVDETEPDGHLERFELRYYDIRFSNLCNLACRSCGEVFSSNWRKDAKNYGWLPKDTPNVDYAGRYKMDMWEQLQPHLDYVENIYFAGGEPLIMEEHYKILHELLRRGRTEVRLVYNTNFTELKHKKQDVLDLWNEFECVSIGASLDAMGDRAEYMRHGTDWAQIERNRERMLEVCPGVDFYISGTLSVMNSHHLPDFHRNWVERGFIGHGDFNVNICQMPDWYRIDILPEAHKKILTEKYQDHVEWIRPHDHLKRARNGFKSAVNFMNKEDRTDLIPKFREVTRTLDGFRGQDFVKTFPEMKDLMDE